MAGEEMAGCFFGCAKFNEDTFAPLSVPVVRFTDAENGAFQTRRSQLMIIKQRTSTTKSSAL